MGISYEELKNFRIVDRSSNDNSKMRSRPLSLTTSTASQIGLSLIEYLILFVFY